MHKHKRIEWPGGRQFAFTITDDTDSATLEQIRPVYETLAANGLRTTKTVWPLRALGPCITGGDTLEREEYLRWVLELQASGFEIAMHGVADETSTRERVQLGLDRYRELIGQDPVMHINHVGQREGMYWGAARLRPPVSWMYRAWIRMRRQRIERYEGHRPGSPYFWGDLCKARTRFVRNLVWSDINTTAADRLFPYHDSSRPWVNYWYSASNGAGFRRFLRLVEPANMERLAAQGGACIVYTHLGTFPSISPEFSEAIERISRMNGWFVPASELLEHIGQQRGFVDLARHRLAATAMELRWMRDNVRAGLADRRRRHRG